MKLESLAAPFSNDEVSWRVQGTPYQRNNEYFAMALAYIDARDVQDRLDQVCGPENWQDTYEVLPSGLYVAKIGINIDGNWVWKSDGAGETSVEGKKGGISDAFKRAGVKWGIGRYLYRLDSPWVRCEVRRKGDKTYWKSWLEDPWSKVQSTSYHRAEAERENAEIEAVIGNIASIEDMDSLRSYWASIPHNVQKHPEVIKAKEDRKAILTEEKEAA